MTSTKLQWNKCKWRLAVLWLASGGVVFSLLLAMSIMGKFDADLQEAWGWFLTNMMPNLSLIVGVLVTETGAAFSKRQKSVNSSYFWLAYILSAFYIVVVIFTLVSTSAPLADHRGIAMLHLSNLWLGPLQGLASAALGIFYVRAQPTA
jgi:hypothetical protein